MKRRVFRHTTHRQANLGGVVDTGYAITEANSFTAPCLQHHWRCRETGSPTTWTDSQGGVIVTPTGNSPNSGNPNVIADPGDADSGIGVQVQEWDGVATSGGSVVDPVASDLAITIVAKARLDPSGPATDTGGEISFYLGDFVSGVSGYFRVQPYLAAWRDGRVLADAIAGGSSESLVVSNCATDIYTPMLSRTEGQVYAIAGVKRGNLIEHWVDGVQVGEVNLLTFHAESAYWEPYVENMVLADRVAVSHSKYDADTAWEWPQLYYDVKVCHFAGGAPNDIGEMMLWTKEQVQLDNKALWPGWVTL
jgi:hypothetical protein